MANRAYLYFVEEGEALVMREQGGRLDRNQQAYLDSRHQLPLAWLLFFQPEDVWLVPGGEGKWNTPFFVSNWAAAKEEFRSRLPLLFDWFPGEISSSDADNFYSWLESLRKMPSEKFLVVDPGELELEEEDVPLLQSALAALDDDLLDADQKFDRLDFWSHSKYQYNSLSRHDVVFGIYYGGYGDE